MLITRRSNLAIIIAILGGLALLLSVSPWTGEPDSAVGAHNASPNASPVAATPSPTGPQSVSVAGEVTIFLTDQGFSPSYVEATNGHQLTITLVNTGTRPHGFTTDAYQIDVLLDPGESTTVVIPQPDLGDFTFYSDAPGDHGFEGMLTFYI